MIFELDSSHEMRASSGDGQHRKGMPTAPPHPRAAAARARAAAQRLRERRFSVVPASDRVLMLHFPVLAGLPSRPDRAKSWRPREHIMCAGSHNELERCGALLLGDVAHGGEAKLKALAAYSCPKRQSATRDVWRSRTTLQCLLSASRGRRRT